MDDVLKLLTAMGATNIVYDESKSGAYSTTLTFEYENKKVTLWGEWFNTSEAGIGGTVDELP